MVVVARLRARRDELVDAIFVRLRGAAFDRAGEDDAEYMAGLRATVAMALEYVLTGIERGETDGSPPTPQVPAVALEQARRAARVGVALDTVLRRYVVGSALLGEFVMEEADRGEKDWIPPTSREALREALRAQASGIDRLITAVSRAYGEEAEAVGHAPSPPPPRTSPGRVVGGPRRDLILDAVVQIVAERGVARASVGAVIARAKVWV